MTDEKAKAIAFIGQSLDRKLLVAILSFDFTKFIVLVKLKQILQSLE